MGRGGGEIKSVESKARGKRARGRLEKGGAARARWVKGREKGRRARAQTKGGRRAGAGGEGMHRNTHAPPILPVKVRG